MVNRNRTTCGVVPACLVGCSTLRRVQHDVLVHVDQTRRHGASATIYYGGAGCFNRFGNLDNVVVLNQHAQVLGKLVAEAVKNINVGE